MNRQKLLLVVLLAVLAVAVVTSYFRMPHLKRVDHLTYTTGMKAAKVRASKGEVHRHDDTRLDLSLLDSAVPRSAGYRRNPFLPIIHGESSVPPIPGRHLPAIPLPPPPPKVLPPVVPQVEQTPLQRDMGQFTFLGFLKKGSRKIIFLSRSDEIFLVKKGDRLAGKYEVSNVTDEALTIQMLGGGGEIIIPLVENRPLAAPN